MRRRKTRWTTYPLTIARPFDAEGWVRAEFYTRRKSEVDYPFADPYRDEEGRFAREAQKQEESK